MRKVIFCDLDGTLLQRGRKQIRKETLAAIREQIKRGAIFCVASGRPYNELKPLFFELSRDIVFICLDGALVMHRDCVLYKNRLCKIEAARLCTLSSGAKIYGRTQTIDISPDEPRARIEEKINRLGSEVFKVALINASPQSSARICYNRGGITEYVAASSDKAAAAKIVLDKFSEKAENSVAIGDGENDIPLLALAGKAYKMKDSDHSLAPFPYPQIENITEFLKTL